MNETAKTRDVNIKQWIIRLIIYKHQERKDTYIRGKGEYGRHEREGIRQRKYELKDRDKQTAGERVRRE